MVGMAAEDGMDLELAEGPREGDVRGRRDVLVAEEEDLVLQQGSPDRRNQRRIAAAVSRSTPWISAPRAGETGSTVIPFGRSTIAFS